MALYRNALTLVRAGYGTKLTVLHIALLAIKIVGNHAYPIGVSTKDDFIGKLLGFEMKVKYRTVLIDNKLRRGYNTFFHNLIRIK